MNDPRLGVTVVHRRYVPYSHAHYGGNLVDGAYSLALFGDAATELCIRTDGDEGLFAGYTTVTFHAPVHAGDGALSPGNPPAPSPAPAPAGAVVEVPAAVTRQGNRSRTVDFTCHVTC